MFDLEAGPLEIGDPPLWPRIYTPGLLESHAADFAASRSAAEPQIVGASIDVAGEGVPNEDGAYAVLAAPGEESNGEEFANAGEPLPDGTYENGDVINTHAAAVAPYLPDADGGVDTNFADPPTLDLSVYQPRTPPPPTYVDPDNPSEDTER